MSLRFKNPLAFVVGAAASLFIICTVLVLLWLRDVQNDRKHLLVSLPLCKWFDRLLDKARRNLFSVQAIKFWPFVGKVICSEDLVDPGKMNSEVFIKALFLRSMVPVMVLGRHQTF